jgi:NAD(P)-dependent dehydrogenase (short-subunit alcohol dehydrogenase family)
MAVLGGYHALITGGGTGIGAAIAGALARDGAKLSLAGRRRGPLDTTAASWPGTTVIESDVTRDVDCVSMVRAAQNAHGPVDIVIANAGAAESVPVSRMDTAHWQRMLDVNLTGAFLTVQAALPDLLRKTDNGRVRRVVFIASTAGLKGYPYVAAYCAAKHGVVGLARALAAELVAHNITVNAICPGFTETPLLAASIDTIVGKTGRSAVEARDKLAANMPLGRFVTPDEVAAAVVWLCQPSSAAVTGQAISVSGGEV